MTPFADAQAAVLDASLALGTERVDLRACAGRVVAHDIIATEDLVPFARSAMDGFAVRVADVRALPVRLPVAGSAFAAPGQRHLTPGTACAIATGAALPVGADTVIPIEHVEVLGESILVAQSVRAGASIFPPGDDARRGDRLVAAGSVLAPSSIGLLAAAGIGELAVQRRPVVAIVCSGDELVDIDQTPGYGEVRNSNGTMLAAAVVQAGGIPREPVRLRDTRDAVRTGLRAALDRADLVITTGGASVGERDFMKAVLEELGVSFLFRTVGLRPAKPTAFGTLGATLVAVLPGNPAAAFVAFAELVRPALRRLGGYRDVLLPRVSAALAGTIHAKPGRHFAAFSALATGPTGLVATPLPNQCSSLTRTAVDAAGFIIVPPGPRTYGDDDRVDVDVFDWSKLTTDAHATDDSPNYGAYAIS